MEKHPGEILKSARLEQGMSLEQISEKTKIRLRYLHAIEDGEYHLLPGYFYTRGFIKSYAETVGLDPQQILDQFLSEAPKDQELESVPLRTQKKGTYRIRPKPSFLTKGVSSLLLVVFIVLILVVIYWFISSQAENQTGETLPNSVPFQVEEEKLTTPPLAAEQGEGGTLSPQEEVVPPQVPEAPEPTPALTLVNEEGNTSRYRLSGVSLGIEVLATDGDCWLELRVNDANGEVLDEEMLREGDRWRWPGKDEGAQLEEVGQGEKEQEVPHVVRLRAGNPAAIQLEVSGQPIPTGDQANPHNYIIEWSASSPPHEATE